MLNRIKRLEKIADDQAWTAQMIRDAAAGPSDAEIKQELCESFPLSGPSIFRDHLDKLRSSPDFFSTASELASDEELLALRRAGGLPEAVDA